ncbi:MAG: PEP-CTERM sorting domain-containing protein [Planctomycetota bacterium]
MIRVSRLGQMALGLLVAFAGSASTNASDITFDLSSGVTGSNFSKTVSGYTLTFLNPTGGTFYGDSSGLYISSAYMGFAIQVTGNALIYKNYEISSIGGLGAVPFDLSGGTGTSTGNSLTVGVHSYNSSYSMSPGQTVSLFSNTSSGYSQMQYMTFTTVPEPSTYALAVIATGVMAAVARRRKTRKA